MTIQTITEVCPSCKGTGTNQPELMQWGIRGTACPQCHGDGRKLVARVGDYQELKEYLFRAFCWLQSPQDSNAAVDHLGLDSDIQFSFGAIPYIHVCFCPEVFNCGGRPGVIFNTAGRFGAPFTPGALNLARAAVRSFYPIYEEWNGYSKEFKKYLDTFSIAPDVFPGEGVHKARINYRASFLPGYDPEAFKKLVKPLGWR